MNNYIKFSTVSVIAVIFIACGGGNGKGKGKHGGSGDNFDIDSYAVSSVVTQEVKESLSYMGNEERLAYDIYTTLYNYHRDRGTSIKQLSNIPKNSEIKHVKIVQDLVRRYNIDITTIQNVSNPVADMNIEFESMPMGSYDVKSIQELYQHWQTLFGKKRERLS